MTQKANTPTRIKPEDLISDAELIQRIPNIMNLPSKKYYDRLWAIELHECGAIVYIGNRKLNNAPIYIEFVMRKIQEQSARTFELRSKAKRGLTRDQIAENAAMKAAKATRKTEVAPIV